jgi:hypothetical protein
LETSNTYDTPTAQHISTDSIQDIDLSNLTISPSHSTPRAAKRPKSRDQTATFTQSLDEEQDVTGTIKSTSYHQRRQGLETPDKQTARYDNNEATPQASPFLPPMPTSIPHPSTQRKQTDPLLHRVLDRNYRVQATPLTTSRYTNRLPHLDTLATPTTAARNRTAQLLAADDSILSSPEPAAPELHAEIFSSPQRKPTRTPGISVLTPAANRRTKNKTPIKSAASLWDDTDDDLDDDLDAFGQSPPKTMQFHIPQRRLLKTPGTYLALLRIYIHTYLLTHHRSKRSVPTNRPRSPQHRRSRGSRRRLHRRYRSRPGNGRQPQRGKAGGRTGRRNLLNIVSKAACTFEHRKDGPRPAGQKTYSPPAVGDGMCCACSRGRVMHISITTGIEKQQTFHSVR